MLGDGYHFWQVDLWCEWQRVESQEEVLLTDLKGIHINNLLW